MYPDMSLQALVDESVFRYMIDGTLITLVSQGQFIPHARLSGHWVSWPGLVTHWHQQLCTLLKPLLAVQGELKEWLTSRGHGMTRSALLLLYVFCMLPDAAHVLLLECLPMKAFTQCPVAWS